MGPNLPGGGKRWRNWYYVPWAWLEPCVGSLRMRNGWNRWRFLPNRACVRPLMPADYGWSVLVYEEAHDYESAWAYVDTASMSSLFVDPTSLESILNSSFSQFHPSIKSLPQVAIIFSAEWRLKGRIDKLFFHLLFSTTLYRNWCAIFQRGTVKKTI